MPEAAESFFDHRRRRDERRMPDHDRNEESRAAAAGGWLTMLVRLIGLSLLLAGLAVAVLVLLEAWSLYKHPERIEVFADAVEAGSNVDKALRARPGAPLSTLDQGDPAQGAGPAAEREAGIRLSYFFAWFIVFVLILLITRIAVSAMTVGGRLALHDLRGLSAR